MYYSLNCFGPLFKEVVSLGAIPDVEGVESWMSGQPIAVPVPEPLVIEIDPDEPGSPLEMYQLEALVLSKRLARALEEAGVDNLQLYDVELRGPASGRVFDDYCVANVVGPVSCADLARSAYVAPPGRPTISVVFESLVVDEARAGGILMLRLAESLSTILVHDKVKTHLERRGFDMLTFRSTAPPPAAASL
jgi:hypothetical protein